MSFFNDVLNILKQYYPFLLRGVGYTLLISLIGTVAGFLIGLLTGMLRTAPSAICFAASSPFMSKYSAARL